MKWFLASLLGIIIVLQSITIDAGIMKRKALKRAIQSSVYITGFKNGYGLTEIGEFHGSGMAILPGGYILTCNHVVRNTQGLTVISGRDTLYPIIIGVDTTDDIAIIKVDKNLPCVEIAKNDNTDIGDDVYTIGYPLFLGLTVTKGIMSSVIDNTHGSCVDNTMEQILFLVTSAPLNPGGSGGGLLNKDYQLIGVNSRIATFTGYYVGYGISIPLETVMNSVRKIMIEGGLERALSIH